MRADLLQSTLVSSVDLTAAAASTRHSNFSMQDAAVRPASFSTGLCSSANAESASLSENVDVSASPIATQEITGVMSAPENANTTQLLQSSPSLRHESLSSGEPSVGVDNLLATLLGENTPATQSFELVREAAATSTTRHSVLLYVVNRLPKTELRISTKGTMASAKVVRPRSVETWKSKDRRLAVKVNVQPEGYAANGRNYPNLGGNHIDRISVSYYLKRDTALCRQGARLLLKEETHMGVNLPPMRDHSKIKLVVPKPFGTASIAMESMLLQNVGRHTAGPFPVLLIFRETSTPLPSTSDPERFRELLLPEHYQSHSHEGAGTESSQSSGRSISSPRRGHVSRPSLPDFPTFTAQSYELHMTPPPPFAEDPTSVDSLEQGGVTRSSTQRRPASYHADSSSHLPSTRPRPPSEAGSSVQFFSDVELTDDDDGFDELTSYQNFDQLVLAVQRCRLENRLLKGHLRSLLGISPLENPPSYDY